jgi:quinol monooxygenase YgiN
MVILRFKIRSKPDKSDELMSALAEVIAPARATNGVINFDIAATCSTLIRSSRPRFTTTVPLSNYRNHFRRWTGSWRCCQRRW